VARVTPGTGGPSASDPGRGPAAGQGETGTERMVTFGSRLVISPAKAFTLSQSSDVV